MSQKSCPDENLKLDNQLCFALYRTLRAVTQTYRPFLDQIGLTYPQYLVMLVLWEQDDVSLKKIGERLMLDSGTLTPLIKKMQSQGLLQRQRSTQDEREIRILLTPEGRNLKKQASQIPEKMGCIITITEQTRLRMQTDLNKLLAQILK